MQTVREVYSLLMPVQDGRIIVPRAAVAEVMGFTTPKRRPDGAPAFLLGFIDWQGQQVPLVSFEAARGRSVPERSRRARIAVVFGIAGRLEPNVFAIVTQGYPYLVRVNENVLQREEMETTDPLVLARVRMANEKPFIPDLEALEHQIADGLGLEAPATMAVAPVDELDAFAGGEEDDDLEAGLVGEDPDEDSGADNTPSAMGTAADVELDVGVGTIVDVDPNDVTAFGDKTDYSAEIGALSAALEGAGENAADDSGAAETEDTPAANADYAIDLSGLEVAEDESVAAPDTNGDTDADADGGVDAGEIDFSDLSIELDEEEKDEDK